MGSIRNKIGVYCPFFDVSKYACKYKKNRSFISVIKLTTYNYISNKKLTVNSYSYYHQKNKLSAKESRIPNDERELFLL